MVGNGLQPTGLWPDAGGWTLILGLVLKETPFLLLAAAAQLSALNVDASLQIGRTLGYAPARCWSRLILPRLYPRVRLSLLIILAFNLSVVDMAMLLGPGNPPTFSVLLMSLVNDPGSRAAASAGALLLALGVLFVFMLVWCHRTRCGDNRCAKACELAIAATVRAAGGAPGCLRCCFCFCLVHFLL